jgi:hypothetical protein
MVWMDSTTRSWMEEATDAIVLLLSFSSVFFFLFFFLLFRLLQRVISSMGIFSASSSRLFLSLFSFRGGGEGGFDFF